MVFRVCTGAVPIGSACASLNVNHDCANRTLQPRRLWCMPPKTMRIRTAVNHRAMRGVAGTFASSPDSLEACWEFLKDYTLKDARGRGQDVRDSADGRDRMRASIQTVMQEPWPDSGWVPGPGKEVLLGVLASDIRYALRALRDWCDALDLPHHRPTSRVPGVESIAQVQGSVYIKYNSCTGLCYATTYSGQDRGVLLQLAQQQLGHFPLGLFDEAMEKPPPTL